MKKKTFRLAKDVLNSGVVSRFSIEGMEFEYHPSAEKAAKIKELVDELESMVKRVMANEQELDEDDALQRMCEVMELILGEGATEQIAEETGRSLTMADCSALMEYVTGVLRADAAAGVR